VLRLKGHWPTGIFSRVWPQDKVLPRIPVGAGQHLRKDGAKVRTILVSSTLFATVVTSVSLGIISAYAAIHGILHIFARQPRHQEEQAAPLIAQEATLQQ